MTSKSKKGGVEEKFQIDAELIARCRIDPVEFSKVFCSFYPHWYQSRILRDDSHNIAVRMGRQMGKTSSTAVKALHNAYTRPDCVTPTEKNTIVIIAPSQRQSKIMYDQIRAYIHANPILESSITKSTLDRIELDNNSIIHNFPVGDNAERVRGFAINLLIVDEAAYIRERIYTALLPSLASTNGKLMLIGTPAARSGLFFQAFYPDVNAPHDLQFSSHWFPYSYATEVQKVGTNGVPLIDKKGEPVRQLASKWIEYQRTTMSPGAFAQEYEARFTDDSLSFFNRQDILANAEDFPMEFVNDGESLYSMGVDFAKYHDSYVAIVVKRPREGPMRIVYIYEQRKRNYSETVPKTIEIAKRFGCQYVFCDRTGVGEPNVEVITEGLKGHATVEGVNMTSLQKQNDMYSNVARLLGEGMLKIPISARELITQLSMVMRTITPSGKVKIEAADGQHDDFADAVALACMISMHGHRPSMFVANVPSLFSNRGGRRRGKGVRGPDRLEVVLDARGRPIGKRMVKKRRY